MKRGRMLQVAISVVVIASALWLAMSGNLWYALLLVASYGIGFAAGELSLLDVFGF